MVANDELAQRHVSEGWGTVASWNESPRVWNSGQRTVSARARQRESQRAIGSQARIMHPDTKKNLPRTASSQADRGLVDGGPQWGPSGGTGQLIARLLMA